MSAATAARSRSLFIEWTLYRWLSLLRCGHPQVITDPLTSRSKGYGFVRFGSEAERDRALGEMSGHFISNRPIRVSLATAKKSSSLQVQPPRCALLACAL